MKESPYVSKVSVAKTRIWKNKTPLLHTLDLELTERCNNNCLHCYINLPANDVKAMERELSTDEIKKILEEAAELGCLQIRFTGGEPLIRKDFKEIYLFSRKLGLKVTLFTNATLITDELAGLFSTFPPLELIEISIYGMKQTSYEAVTRTAGSYEAARRGLNLLLKKGVPFVVKGALLPPNKNELKEFESWAATIPWMDGPPSYMMLFDLRARRDSAPKNRSINRLRLSPEEVLNGVAGNRQEYLKNTKNLFTRVTSLPGNTLFCCGAGIGSGCVDAYGFFQPCLSVRHQDTIYDLKTGNLKDALVNFFPKVKKIKSHNPGYLARCARCFLMDLCDHCPAKSWMEYGRLDSPVDYLCQVTHVQARCLGLLAEKEMAWEVTDWKERLKNFCSG